MQAAVITEIEEGVGLLTLNKPERHNALDEALIAEITAALLEMEAHPQVRVVVLSAVGKSFCAGNDLNWMKRASSQTSQENIRDARNLGRLLSTLNALPKPTIARVQGPAYGGGVGLIAACDLAVASYDALFALTEVKLGLIPATVTPFLVSAIGARYCRRYLLSAERFSAAEAYRIGLVHEIVPGEEQLDEAIGEWVERLLKNGPVAQAECKSQIREIDGKSLGEAMMEDAAQRITRVRSGLEAREGLSAFLEKRKPVWAND